ncbi:MAG: prolipoprotein diacylglyceryl transferase [Anaerolineae bacterium]|nr:prolipoprotein diacylglyceryl transferase [Thermoflexales bacterium]MDW8406486.1 prolipoprotein diacylglyceryl transferase [Anaerolineae bacterium]
MPTHVSIGALSINTYTFWIGLCAIVGVARIMWQGDLVWRDRVRTLDGALLIGLCALAAGRVGYLALNASYFVERPSDITLAPAAGVSEQTAILGMLAGWRLTGRLSWAVRRPSALQLIAFASLIGIGASIGCVSNACAYGHEVFWRDGVVWHLRVDWPDAYWRSNPRLPTQVFMVVWLVICVGLTKWLTRGAQRANSILGHWLLWLSAGDFVLQFARADAMPTLLGLRAAQALDIVLFVIGYLAVRLDRRAGALSPSYRSEIL